MKKPRKERRIQRRADRKARAAHVAWVTNRYGRRNYMTEEFKKALEQVADTWKTSDPDFFSSFLNTKLDPPPYAEKLAEAQRRLEYIATNKRLGEALDNDRPVSVRHSTAVAKKPAIEVHMIDLFPTHTGCPFGPTHRNGARALCPQCHTIHD